ncbi:MAG: ASKHA domain-containing protein [Planctomycetota bacterium]
MTLRLEIDDTIANASAAASIFECAETANVAIPTSCRKNGKCRECLVEVLDGMDLLESPGAEEDSVQSPFRLSCCARFSGAEGLVRCRTLRRGSMQIATEGEELSSIDFETDPVVRREDGVLKLHGGSVGDDSGPLLGISIDIGTTTVVLRVVDLETGQTLETRSFENPQRFGGSDVMARIQYDIEHPGRQLQRTLLAYLAREVGQLRCEPTSIYEYVVAGNSTMRDLFFGLDVTSIGQRPYRSLVEHEVERGERDDTTLSAPAKKLRLPAHPAASVFGLPLIRGHVGADAAACALAIDLANEDRLVALMDIGTNTELLIGNRERVVAASCPAGPAFEGGAISCGMPGVEGAIDRVTISSDGSATWSTIGDAPPQGICGSGLVACLSELRRTELLNELGRFEDESERFTLDAERNIYLSEADISELAQAKGANVAGFQLALKHNGSELDDVEVFYLAGGFAKHLDVDSARRIGLIPDLPDERIVQIGNASIEGATRALCSESRRRELSNLLRRVTHVELETDERFFDVFVDGCQFQAFGSSQP